jgi:hypothetical protein
MKSILDDSHREALLDRIGQVRPDSVRRWGRMTPHGMICHLVDSFAGVLGDRPISDVSTLAGRTVVRWMALSTPIPWPKGVPTTPEIDQERDGTPPGDFDADRAHLLRVTQDFVHRLDPSTMRHPLFGRMSTGEWGRWGYRHVDHHLRQFGL